MQGYSFRDKVRSTHKRRAVAAGVPGSFDKYDVVIRLGKQQNRCHYCLEPLALFGPEKFQIDHFIPLSKGGSNYAINLVIACPGCNLSKGNKLPWEYRPARFEKGCRRDG